MGKGQSLSKIKRKRNRAQKRAVREKERRIAEKEITNGASASSSLPSISKGGGSNQYDVFLSFRGSDTRNEFTDHLYRSLISVGISVFKDDNSLEIGKDFNSEILNAITRSKVSIPIISENYASSKWCLRELVRIMDCQKSMSHTVLPIFYKVLPSDVRYLNGNFGEAFHLRKKHFDKEDIQEGQRVLIEVSYLNGWESEKFANGMHDQLRDLGRSIFCQGQPPQRCLKPWLEDKALRSNMEMGIESRFNYWHRGYSSTCTSELFKNLPSSRFLSLCSRTISGDFNELFPELRWLQWLYIEPDIFSLAINLHLSKLVVLELPQNKVTDDWGGWSSIMAAKQLKVLNLSYSRELRSTPNLSAFTNLEILILFNCYKLKQVDPSIGKLKSLISLNLRGCHNLKELPKEVGELQELKELLLKSSGITKIPI